MNNLLESPIEYLKGVGPAKGELLKKELQIFNFRDLLWNFPFRYVDKTKFHKISEIFDDSQSVQLKGILVQKQLLGAGIKKRLTARLRDTSGSIELIWFKGVTWVDKFLVPGTEYIVFGKPSNFNGRFNIAHPEIEVVKTDSTDRPSALAPVYGSTEKLNGKGLDSKGRRRLMSTLLGKLEPIPTIYIQLNILVVQKT